MHICEFIVFANQQYRASALACLQCPHSKFSCSQMSSFPFEWFSSSYKELLKLASLICISRALLHVVMRAHKECLMPGRQRAASRRRPLRRFHIRAPPLRKLHRRQGACTHIFLEINLRWFHLYTICAYYAAPIMFLLSPFKKKPIFQCHKEPTTQPTHAPLSHLDRAPIPGHPAPKPTQKPKNNNEVGLEAFVVSIEGAFMTPFIFELLVFTSKSYVYVPGRL